MTNQQHEKDFPIADNHSPSRKLPLAETGDESQLYKNRSGIASEPSFQHGDLAFAICLLKCNAANESQLASATKLWTSFGATRLSDHLVRSEMITPQQKMQIEESADRLMSQKVKALQRRALGSGETEELSRFDRELTVHPVQKLSSYENRGMWIGLLQRFAAVVH